MLLAIFVGIFRTYDVEYFKFGPLHQITAAKLQLIFRFAAGFEKNYFFRRFIAYPAPNAVRINKPVPKGASLSYS